MPLDLEQIKKNNRKRTSESDEIVIHKKHKPQHHEIDIPSHKKDCVLTHSIFPMLFQGNHSHAKEVIANKDFLPEKLSIKTAILAVAAQISSPKEMRELIKPLTDELREIRRTSRPEDMAQNYQESELYKILTAVPSQIIAQIQEVQNDPQAMEELARMGQIAAVVVDCVSFGLDPTGLSALKLASSIAVNILSDIEIEGQPGLTEILHMIGEVAKVTSFIADFATPDFGTLVTVGKLLIDSGVLEDLEEFFEDHILIESDESEDKPKDEKEEGVLAEAVLFMREEIETTIDSLTALNSKTKGFYENHADKVEKPDLKEFGKQFIGIVSKDLSSDKKKEISAEIKNFDSKKHQESFAKTIEKNRDSMKHKIQDSNILQHENF